MPSDLVTRLRGALVGIGIGIGIGTSSGARLRREALYVVTSGITVAAAPTGSARIATAAVLAVGFAAYLALTRGPSAGQAAAFLISGAAGVAAILLVPRGLGPVPVLLATVHARTVVRGRAGEIVTWAFAAAFGISIAWVSRSYVGLLAGLGVPALAGRRLQQAELQAERDRALRLVAELRAAQDAAAQAAALQERGRIARDMHDVLAHTLAGLSLQLQALRAMAAREGVGSAVAEPLDHAADLARHGLEEARAVVGTLRTEAAADALGVEQVATLVGRFPGDAELQVTGLPTAVTAGAGHAVYRAVQESLTNALRYAPGAPVRVQVRWEEQRLRLTVSDPGSAVRAPAGQGSGTGLAGMRERVEAAGGSVCFGPDGKGWRTEVTVPTAQPGDVR